MIQITQNTKEMFRDKIFLKKAVQIACPVALQGMLNTVVNLVDTLMIGTLGATAIAAVGLANKVFFVFSLLVFGIVSGSGILAAQFWGSGDVKHIRKVLGLSVVLSMVGAAFFVIPAVAFPDQVMRIFTTSEASISLGARYLRVAALTYPFIALTNVFVALLRAVNKVVVPVCTSCIAIVINVYPELYPDLRRLWSAQAGGGRRRSGHADRPPDRGGSAGGGLCVRENSGGRPSERPVRLFRAVSVAVSPDGGSGDRQRIHLGTGHHHLFPGLRTHGG